MHADPRSSSAQWPKLSESLPFRDSPVHCQQCQAGPLVEGDVGDRAPHRWYECDERDQKTPVVITLCKRCSDRLIDPHPRLYSALERWEPFPGTMGICLGCALRDGVRCASPTAKFNGGPGLKITFPHASRVHLNFGGRRGKWTYLFSGPATACGDRREASA